MYTTGGQPLNKKAFTLIELLAVIVILAIIALIAVPIVINIISDTKEKAIKINAENYMDAVELAVANSHMKAGEKVLISGTYDIIQGGKAIKLIKDENDKQIPENEQLELSVNYTGEGLKSGQVKLIDGKVRGLTGVKTDEGYDILIILGEVKIIKDSNPVTLITGSSFNSKIKTLVSVTETKYDAADTKVKSIEFLGYGIIPSGYTLEEFQKLERVDISANQDETIYAIYDDKDKVYIYSEDAIIFNVSSTNMFYKFNSVEIINFGEYIDTSNVTSMQSMFNSCSNLITLDVSNFDTSDVTNMVFMFRYCSKLTQLDVSNFDTRKVINMLHMFEGCSSLTSLDVSNFDTLNVTNMQGMFANCSGLTLLDVSNLDTSKVTNISLMFGGCSSITSLDLSNFNTNNVKDISQMFNGCSSLTSLDVSNWDTSKVTDMRLIFYRCNNLITLDLNNWDTGEVINMAHMFNGCGNLTSLNIGDWNTSKVTNMSSMFRDCTNLKNLNISSFDTSKVTDMGYMFWNTSNLKPIYVGEKWVINEGTATINMFYVSKTTSLEELCEPNSTEEWCVVN